jgi:hypothetical protein
MSLPRLLCITLLAEIVTVRSILLWEIRGVMHDPSIGGRSRRRPEVRK